MIVWTCTRAKHTMHKEVAGEEEEESKQNCLPNRDLSINATIIYLCTSICGKGEFGAVSFYSFSVLCLLFRICMQRTKMTCFTFSAMLYCVYWMRYVCYMVCMFQLKYNLCSKFQPFFCWLPQLFRSCIACVRQSLNRNHKKHTLTVNI